MGSDRFYPEERPVREVSVRGFRIDRHPGTVAEFRRFVKETGHVTWAENAPEAARYPDADPEPLVPGSLVLKKTAGPVDLRDFHNWWSWTPGANWRHPEGPASNVVGRELHPVTPRRVLGRGRVRRLGGQGAADRSGVGVRRTRHGRPQISVGKFRSAPRPRELRRQKHRLRLERSRHRRWLRGNFARGRFPARRESVRSRRHGWQRLGMVPGLPGELPWRPKGESTRSDFRGQAGPSRRQLEIALQ